jgi:hypothetical protein
MFIGVILKVVPFQVVKRETFPPTYYDKANYFNLLLSKKNNNSVD